MNEQQPCTLLLADGSEFSGFSFGAQGTAIGEIVFSTNMVGYQETLTDPSYYGQIVAQTFPLIGNYGVNSVDAESGKVHLRGYIVREWCEWPSNFRCEGDLDGYLCDNGVVGLYGIDTRALTKKLRSAGVMNGAIIPGTAPTDVDKDALLSQIRAYAIKDAVQSVQLRREPTQESAGLESRYHVVLFDFGAKRNIERELVARGCHVTIVPHNTSPTETAALKPDGIMLSNGPGDPAENVQAIANLRELAKSGIPIFGICLGHQLLALASGARTEKLKYGHRGANQPVIEPATGRTYITSQNHGYAVVGDSLPREMGEVSFVNGNDGTCEGINYTAFPAFTVQFHPEACGGPHDTEFLFDRFVQMMEKARG